MNLSRTKPKEARGTFRTIRALPKLKALGAANALLQSRLDAMLGQVPLGNKKQTLIPVRQVPFWLLPEQAKQSNNVKREVALAAIFR